MRLTKKAMKAMDLSTDGHHDIDKIKYEIEMMAIERTDQLEYAENLVKLINFIGKKTTLSFTEFCELFDYGLRKAGIELNKNPSEYAIDKSQK